MLTSNSGQVRSLYIMDNFRRFFSSKVKILGVDIDNFYCEEFLSILNSGFVVTPNVDHLMLLRDDQEFMNAYKEADYRVCDSQILLYVSRILGTPIKEKISGSDLLPAFCEYHRYKEDIKIFLVGGAKGIAQKAQKKLNEKVGRNIVVAAHSPSFGFETNETECKHILEMILKSEANTLVVGLGAPKQEKWIAKYRDQLPNINIFLAVGAAIDFEANHKPRAPKLISQAGLEWLYRLLHEPKRLWRRYLLRDSRFFLILLRENFFTVKKSD